VIAVPPARLAADTLTDVPPHVARTTAGRVVTAAQVERAVLQLRERPRQTAVEHVQAVLRALELTVEGEPSIPGAR
jgi:hypothetical protein